VTVTLNIPQHVQSAERRIRPHVVETPLERATAYDRADGPRVWLKLENLQHTGSFKVRGALNKILALSDDERARGVVAASTGNHGAAVAYALGRFGASAVVFVPRDASQAKVRRIEELGATVRAFGRDPVETEIHARAYAAEQELIYISPYNDPQVIAGQGTIGPELERQLDRVDAVFVSLGGGGLICGIAGYLRSVNPEIKIVGCSPENSAVMIRSVEAGRILEVPSQPTLSDGTAGGIEPGAITLELCRALVDEYVSVTEDEIRDALRRFVRLRSMPIEGAAAVAIAAYLRLRNRIDAGNVVIVLCGGNIDADVLSRILADPG
jgi:threonine dehydratase